MQFIGNNAILVIVKRIIIFTTHVIRVIDVGFHVLMSRMSFSPSDALHIPVNSY